MEISGAIHWSNALEGLTPAEVRAIEQRLVTQTVSPRSPIFNQGDPSNALHVIRSGRVRLIRLTARGEEFATGVWSDGYIIGLISAYLGEPRFLTAQSVERTTLLVLQRDALLMFMETIPRFAINIASLLARLASDSIQRSAPLALDSVAQKLGRALAQLATPDAGGAGGHTVQGLSQEDLAHMVGASRSWVNQALASFEREGLIKRQNRRIHIVDMATFEKMLLAFDR